MKKIQITFAAVALLLASVGVFASEVAFTTIAYTDDTSTPLTKCDNIITAPCVEDDGDQCTTSANLLVWKRVDGGACVAFQKP
jgi:hypothetical protein